MPKNVSWWKLPEWCRKCLEKHGLGPGSRIAKGGRLDVPDEDLLRAYRALRTSGLLKHAAFRALAAEHGVSFRTIKRHINRLDDSRP